MKTLTVQHLKKVFGSGETAITAVADVSFEVAGGEIVLIMGPSGSGKTTLLSMIGGLLTPTAGMITINGTNITEVSQRQLPVIRLHEIGFVFQSFNLFQNLSARENVQYIGELAGMSPKEARKKSEHILTRLHMNPRMHALPSELSGGQQQRVSVARALMNDPKLMLADEPTGNLDSKSGHEVMMLFHNIAKEEQRSVIIVSHDQRIRDIADRTLWIEDGRMSDVPPQSEHLERDPVCGMRIDPRYTPYKKVVDKKTYVFCSEDCLKKFKA
jgi:putative ABC transport system ATP-binding protein